MYVLSVQYSCAVVSVFLFCGKANLVRFTLFYFTLLTLMDRMTDRQMDGRRNEYTRFAWAGGTCPRFVWAGGIFSPVVMLCQFLVLAGNRFRFYILLMYLGYRTIHMWCCVSFLVLAGNSFLCL